MSRYIAKANPTYPQIGSVTRFEPDGGVELGEDVYFTPAEAHIIAWALNAVSEGKRLYALAPLEFVDAVEFDHALRVYDGPTDGVAP